jgi:hypothetical protein
MRLQLGEVEHSKQFDSASVPAQESCIEIGEVAEGDFESGGRSRDRHICDAFLASEISSLRGTVPRTFSSKVNSDSLLSKANCSGGELKGSVRKPRHEYRKSTIKRV